MPAENYLAKVFGRRSGFLGGANRFLGGATDFWAAQRILGGAAVHRCDTQHGFELRL
jgi:hypothetical protein